MNIRKLNEEIERFLKEGQRIECKQLHLPLNIDESVTVKKSEINKTFADSGFITNGEYALKDTFFTNKDIIKSTHLGIQKFLNDPNYEKVILNPIQEKDTYCVFATEKDNYVAIATKYYKMLKKEKLEAWTTKKFTSKESSSRYTTYLGMLNLLKNGELVGLLMPMQIRGYSK